VRADLAVKLFGDDLEVLRAKAREVEGALRAIPGGEDVMTEQLTGQPTLQVEVDRAAIARHGIPAAEVLAVVEALGGTRVGTLHEGDRRFPIVARLAEAYRADAGAVGAAFVTTGDGMRLPLSSLARITTVTGPAAIQREWGQRRIVVQANVRGRDLAGFVGDARKAVLGVALPPGYHVRFGGEFEHLERASRRLMVVIPAALALVGALLYATYGRARDALRVFTGVPLAAAGGVVALWLRGLPFSISAGVGFVALSGIAVLADMVLVSTFRQLRAAGVPQHEAIAAAAERRLRPVLMTALVASVGFLPMALNTGIGAEVQRPLATVVIGGVMTSALLTLLVLPALLSLGRDGDVARAARP
jgi:cobalt-zinc-cadmium resistance protein CzcA